jgi:hypothetical protein
MKRFLYLILASLAAQAAWAQKPPVPRTLFKDSLANTGGYFGFTPRFTNLMGTDVMLAGFSGAMVIKHRLAIGLAGAWSTSTVKNPAYEAYLRGIAPAALEGLELRYGYGGLLIEPLVLHNSAIHIAVPVIVGMGTVAYSYPRSNSGSNSNQRNRTDGQAFFVVEPGLELEVSVVNPVRIGVGGSYLWTGDLALPNTSADALRNVLARFTVKVGGF